MEPTSEQTAAENAPENAAEDKAEPYRVRLPGFLRAEEDVGLGEVIKRATSLAGIRPCADCLQRADALDRRVVFSGRRGRSR
jgi:hypothetical protein